MKNTDLSIKVKDIRRKKGISQEMLAENSGLSLRTIQRIENGETEPRGDSLKRMSDALEVNPDEIMDWAIREDNNYLAAMNLSALGFIIFPLLGIIIPLILWISKKNRVKNVNKVAKEILNFQITWNMLYFIPYLWLLFGRFVPIPPGALTGSIANPWLILFSFFAFLYLLNLTLIIINTNKAYNYKPVKYFLRIKFIK